MVILITVVVCMVVLWWANPPSQARLSPDGCYYKLDQSDQPRPYCFRWAIPRLLRKASLRAWYYQSAVCAALLGLGAGWLAEFYGYSGWVATALVMALPVVRTSFVLPVLTDLSGMVGMLGAICLSKLDWGVPAIAMMLGALGEKVPVFAAAQSGSWVWLLGLFAVWLGWFDSRPFRSSDPTWLTKPFAEARKESRLSLAALVLPWGPLLLGLFSPNWTWTDTLVLGLAYAQLGWAQDNARVYMWAFPTMLLRTLDVMPETWYPAAVALAWLSPYRYTL